VWELTQAVQFARSQALTRGQVIRLCPESHTGPAGRQIGCGQDWRQGFLVKALAMDAQDATKNQVLRVFAPLAGPVHLSFRGLRGAEAIDFNALGDTNNNGSFRYQYDAAPKIARRLVINRTGRLRVELTA